MVKTNVYQILVLLQEKNIVELRETFKNIKDVV